MRIIWVLENIEEKTNFYRKFNILLLLASVRLWKKHYPTDVCVLYCDDMTRDVLGALGVLELWDSIERYTHTRSINRKVFWAASKLQVLSEQTEPCIIMDNDTHIYKPIKDFMNPNIVYVHNLEIGMGYYPTSADKYVQQLNYRTRWKTESTNVSFLQLPDPDFTQMYANMSLDFMEQFTKLGAPNSQYLIFSEQLLLKHLLERENCEYKSLISTYWDCKKWNWGEDHENGIWTIDNSEVYLKHYGPLKGFILNNQGGQNYEKEIKHLENCVCLPNLDLTNILNK